MKRFLHEDRPRARRILNGYASGAGPFDSRISDVGSRMSHLGSQISDLGFVETSGGLKKDRHPRSDTRSPRSYKNPRSDIRFPRSQKNPTFDCRVSGFFGDPGARMSDLGSRILFETSAVGSRISDFLRPRGSDVGSRISDFLRPRGSDVGSRISIFFEYPGGSSDRARVF